jgi:hypothetical protein
VRNRIDSQGDADVHLHFESEGGPSRYAAAQASAR